MVGLAFAIATEDIDCLLEANASVLEAGIVHVWHNVPPVSLDVIHFAALEV